MITENVQKNVNYALVRAGLDPEKYEIVSTEVGLDVNGDECVYVREKIGEQDSRFAAKIKITL